MAAQNRVPHKECLADAGKGLEAPASHRIESLAPVVLSAEAARAAEEELADAVRAAGVCRLTVVELAAASCGPSSWVRRVAGR